MKSTSLKLDVIRCDAGTQSRAAINEDAVSEYAERMVEGDKFPPVDVFHDGTEFFLADGFHRVLAATRNGFLDILAAVHNGSARDALWFSIGANRENGIKRTPGDKRAAIELALEKFPERTQQQLAEHVGCAQSYVASVQKQLITTDKLTIPETRKGRDGKNYPTNYHTEPEPDPEPSERLAKALGFSSAAEATGSLGNDTANQTGGTPVPLQAGPVALTDIEREVAEHTKVHAADLEIIYDHIIAGNLEAEAIADVLMEAGVWMQSLKKLRASRFTKDKAGAWTPILKEAA